MSYFEFVQALLLGGVSGIASGLMGIGGAMVSTPGLRLWIGSSASIAIGTPLLVVIPTALTGGYRFFTQGLVNRSVVIPTAAMGGVAAVAGAFLTQLVRHEVVLIFTALLIALVALKILFGKDPPEQHSDGVTPQKKLAKTLGVGLVSGLTSGFFGLGGGIILIPAFTIVLRMKLKEALGTSLIVVAAQAIPGSIVHAWLGNVDYLLAAGLMLGAIPGARLGSAIAIRSTERSLRLIVSGILLVIAALLAISEIYAL